MSQPRELNRESVEAFRRGDTDRARELSEQSLALSRAQDDPSAAVYALMGLARVALREGDLGRVQELATEARALATRRGLEAELALPLHLDAEATRMAGDFERARPLYDESIALNRRLGDERMVRVEQSNLAWVEINERNLDQAEALIEASLTGEDDAYSRAFGAIALARCAAERGDRTRARHLLDDADRLLADTGMVLDPADRPEYEKTVELARA